VETDRDVLFRVWHGGRKAVTFLRRLFLRVGLICLKNMRRKIASPPMEHCRLVGSITINLMG
jgi:hypothetical protein